MNESIKPNDKDFFRKENVGEKTWKIFFRESHVIMKFSSRESNEDFVILENKCRTLYDLKKIRGYIISEINVTLLDIVN